MRRRSRKSLVIPRVLHGLGSILDLEDAALGREGGGRKVILSHKAISDPARGEEESTPSDAMERATAYEKRNGFVFATMEAVAGEALTPVEGSSSSSFVPCTTATARSMNPPLTRRH